jgi:hypothetical protein
VLEGKFPEGTDISANLEDGQIVFIPQLPYLD